MAKRMKTGGGYARLVQGGELGPSAGANDAGAADAGSPSRANNQARKCHGSAVQQLLMGRVTVRQLAERGVFLTQEEAELFETVRRRRL